MWIGWTFTYISVVECSTVRAVYL